MIVASAYSLHVPPEAPPPRGSVHTRPAYPYSATVTAVTALYVSLVEEQTLPPSAFHTQRQTFFADAPCALRFAPGARSSSPYPYAPARRAPRLAARQILPAHHPLSSPYSSLRPDVYRRAADTLPTYAPPTQHPRGSSLSRFGLRGYSRRTFSASPIGENARVATSASPRASPILGRFV